jgi:von Hippel-Lindau disease tumor suppressor protein
MTIKHAFPLSASLVALTASGAFAQNCTDQGALRSPPGATPATELTFVNAGVESRRIFWIDQNGKRKFYKELGPHASYIQPTFVGHPWVIAREDDRCQTVVVARSKPLLVDITRSCLTGRIGSDGRCTEQ